MTTVEMMSLFANHECSVIVASKEENMKFLQLCEDFGVRWRDGQNATSFIPTRPTRGNKTYYFNHARETGMCWGTMRSPETSLHINFSSVDECVGPDIEIDSSFLEGILTT